MVEGDDSKVFIGKKKAMDYVMAAMIVLSKKPVRLLARGRSISRTVDIAEILRNKFFQRSEYGEILISTETFNNEDGTH